MRKLILFIFLTCCQLGIAAENDPPVQDAPQQDGSTQEQGAAQAEGDDLVPAEVTETNESEEESSARFIPTEEISQDLGVSFPVDI